MCLSKDSSSSIKTPMFFSSFILLISCPNKLYLTSSSFGSVLGPILFDLYITDLPDAVKSEAYLFADDT
jgi:hypothetical protein